MISNMIEVIISNKIFQVYKTSQCELDVNNEIILSRTLFTHDDLLRHLKLGKNEFIWFDKCTDGVIPGIDLDIDVNCVFRPPSNLLILDQYHKIIVQTGGIVEINGKNYYYLISKKLIEQIE